jgi:cytochrome c556
MKRILAAVSAIVTTVGLNTAFAVGEGMHQEDHQHQMHTMDTRISLGLAPQMKQHQLSNMREHVDAIKTITGLMSESKYEEASAVAHTKLGLTEEMRAMCNMFDNKDFIALGTAFHKSGDDLGKALKTKNVKASLRALKTTMQYCVQCHATYRQ